MTGGCEQGETINRHLAEAAEQARFPWPSALSGRTGGWPGPGGKTLGSKATILGNLGGTQLQQQGADMAQRAVDSVEANAMMIHLNPLQELVQPDGDRNWHGVLDAIEKCCHSLDVPVIVKEVGMGIGPGSPAPDRCRGQVDRYCWPRWHQLAEH